MGVGVADRLALKSGSETPLSSTGPSLMSFGLADSRWNGSTQGRQGARTQSGVGETAVLSREWMRAEGVRRRSLPARQSRTLSFASLR